MRVRAVASTGVMLTTLLAVGAGGLATAGTASAAPTVSHTASSETVAPLAVVNLGLTTAEAQRLQRWLRTHYSYSGAVDGQLGPQSWRAMQRFLKERWSYNDAVDGIVGPNTIRALQRMLKHGGLGYGGPIDGIAGPETRAAFRNFVYHT